MGIYEKKNQEPPVSDGLVSICIPTYNRPALIGKLLSSILAQTYQNFEIIVTDNSDNFDTQSLIQNHFADPRIKYLKNAANLGMGGNTRKALNLIKGEFFTFTPDDDLWITQSKLESQVAFLKQNREIDIIYTNAESIDYDGNVLEPFGSVYDLADNSCIHVLDSAELLPGGNTAYFLNILTPVIRVDPLLDIFIKSWFFESEEFFCYHLAASKQKIGFLIDKTVALREAEHYRTALEDGQIVDWKKRKDLRIRQIIAIYTALIYLYPDTKEALETAKVNNALVRHLLIQAKTSRSLKLMIITFCSCLLQFRRFNLIEMIKTKTKTGKSFG